MADFTLVQIFQFSDPVGMSLRIWKLEATNMENVPASIPSGIYILTVSSADGKIITSKTGDEKIVINMMKNTYGKQSVSIQTKKLN